MFHVRELLTLDEPPGPSYADAVTSSGLWLRWAVPGRGVWGMRTACGGYAMERFADERTYPLRACSPRDTTDRALVNLRDFPTSTPEVATSVGAYAAS